jgi:hypothetical protein
MSGWSRPDVEDLIFLVHEIRSNCPNVVVFTTSANLLFAHTDAISDLSGMLVFSTYPLFNELQPWTDSNDVENQLRVQFPSEDAEGTYHATLAQLGVEACRPPCTPRLPDLWLSVVGRGGLWPVKFYAADGESIGIFPDSPRELGAKIAALYPPAFQLAFLFTSVVCLLTCLAISQALFNADVMQMERPLAPDLIGRFNLSGLASGAPQTSGSPCRRDVHHSIRRTLPLSAAIWSNKYPLG